MKKIYRLIIVIMAVICSIIFTPIRVNAASELASIVDTDLLTGEQLSKVVIYSNGKISFSYKYGLRRADLFYCVKGAKCDSGDYSVLTIVESSAEEPYIGPGTYEYTTQLDAGFEYRIRVEAYFGKNSAYSGQESIQGSFTVGAVQIADTKDQYINGKNGGIGYSKLRKLLDKIKIIVNTVLIPIIYVVTSLFLVIKGAILGVQIVKSADQPEIRKEKIGALKWLLIGVVITYSATSLVGAVTGFFQNAFNLNF